MKKRPKPGSSLELKVDQDRIFEELSERLYTSYLEAFRELIIQNPFDADARKVEVNVQPDVIEIQDDGTGMDIKLIEEFLIIGSDVKEESKKSRSGRPFIGGKGIGRLSWAQLGNKCVIYTQANGEAHFIEMVRGSRS
ncbi:MAG: ATP-binding protein, partial [Theionarchaea archaeon]|nr:ATP-binding protein [Theionarchaea archaeon]